MDHSPEAGPRKVPAMPERQASCPEHGAFISVNLLRSVWSKCPECSAKELEAEAAAEREKAAIRAERQHREHLDSAQIPARFIGRGFDNFVATTKEQQAALSLARDYAENFPENARRGAGLILAGMPGTGKSHLAAAILQRVLTKDVRYLTCLDLIRAIRETWRRDSDKSEGQVLGYLERLDLLVIDEVGVQYGTEGEQTILFDVLDRRYREMQPTVLLTNQNKPGFKEFVGERTFDRLAETCRWVPFDWASYRPAARKAAA